jgi:hypothetical protein
MEHHGAISSINSHIVLDNVEIENVEFPIYVESGSIILNSSLIACDFICDFINVKGGDALIENCIFYGSDAQDTDAIDLDNVTSGIIRNNRIYDFTGYNSDGIDIGENSENILIESNLIYHSGDKGISVGMGSSVVLDRNLVVGCNNGIAIKDNSAAYVINNTFFYNDTAVSCYEKNQGAGGGTAEIVNTIFSNNLSSSVYEDDLSIISVSYTLSDSELLSGEGNLFSDPLFIDKTVYNLELALGSPCMDGGNPDFSPDDDGSIVDMGAYYTYDPDDYPFEIPNLFNTQFKINEFLSSNDTTNADESGEYDDWLELYNTGTELEDIGGLYLTDDSDNLIKWMIPDGTMIQPQGFLLFWCDEDQDQGDLHTNFKLSTGGEFLALVNIDGVTILDSKTYGDQSTDISYGRVFDGSSNWDFLSPTPGSTNSSSGMEVSVSYNDGWNLVGLPLLVDNASYLYLFEDVVGGTLYGYNDSYFNTNELAIGNGYWLNISNEGFVVISGTPMNNLSITLNEGWNLISGISLEVAVETIIDPDGIIVPGTFYGFEGTYINSSTLVPGKGYWVNALSAGEVTIGSSLSESRPEFDDLTIEANELNINGLSLYFGIEIPDKDKPSYRLPPKPPDGVFDIRFKNDRRLENNFGEIEVINTTEILTIVHDIQIDVSNRYNWVLTAPTGEEYILGGSGEITVPSAERFFLELKVVVPATFTLHQNFPNPFNPITTLRYDLPEDNFVMLTIYDMLGREITQLVNIAQETGFKSVQWDAKDSMGRPVSAGVYLYQIQAGEFVQTKKMVLLK